MGERIVVRSCATPGCLSVVPERQVLCDDHGGHPPGDQAMTDPTPATPDEAALRGDLYLRLLDYYGSPGHAMDIAKQVSEALGTGWSLSRQQGDTVAALRERLAGLSECWHLVKHEPETGVEWKDCSLPDCDEDRKVLGIGADGAGDGR